MKKIFSPTEEHLAKYAQVLVRFALGGGKGVKKGEVVYLSVPEIARPLYIHLYKEILKAGGYVISNYVPSSDAENKFGRMFYENATEQMIGFGPNKYYAGLIDQVDHILRIDAETDLDELKGINSKLIFKKTNASKSFRELYFKKENAGKLTWTIALYGTEARAQEAGLSLKQYWNQIIKACFLDEKNPIDEWKKVFKHIENIKQKLNSLKIKELHIKSTECDLRIEVGSDRSWDGGRGANIPTFEIFTSPKWQSVNGWYKPSFPLYRYGVIIEGIELEFKKGKVVSFNAAKNKEVLEQLLKVKNGDKLGEFSLTDKRFSRIDKFMAEILYDENTGGKYGNTHIALGTSFRNLYCGKEIFKTDKEWQDAGFNNSSVHSDIISTADRIVTAITENGREVVIYKDGMFLV